MSTSSSTLLPLCGLTTRLALAVVAGVLILIYRPFREGDTITVAGQGGTVTAIDLRCTELSSDGKRVLVPNQTIFTSAVVVAPPPPPAGPPVAPPEAAPS